MQTVSAAASKRPENADDLLIATRDKMLVEGLIYLTDLAAHTRHVLAILRRRLSEGVLEGGIERFDVRKAIGESHIGDAFVLLVQIYHRMGEPDTANILRGGHSQCLTENLRDIRW